MFLLQIAATPAVDLAQITPWLWAISIFAAMMTGLAKAGLGGMGIVLVPLMAMIFPAKQSVGILLPMLVVGDILGVCFYRRHAIWKEVFTALPLALVGIGGGWIFMKYSGVSDHILKVIIGLLVLLMLGLGSWQKWRKNKKSLQSEDTTPAPESSEENRPWAKIILLGLLGGFSTMAANAAGPVFTLYMLYLGLSKNQFIGTWAWLFLLINLSKVPLHWDLGNITLPSLQYNAILIPAIVIGFLLGYWLVKKIPQERFEQIIRFLAALGALKMILP